MVKWFNLVKPQRARLLPILSAGCLSFFFFYSPPSFADTSPENSPVPTANQNPPATANDKQHTTLDAVIKDDCLKDTDQIEINSRGVIESSSHCDNK